MKDHTKRGPDFLSMKVSNEIRRHWRAGKKQITLDGTKYNLSKFTRRAAYVTGGVTKRKVESWISVRPADGSLIPCASIELAHQGNMRTVRSK